MFSALILITVMCLEQQISRMISDGSCDTEDSSNDSEKSRLNYILKYIQIENPYYCKAYIIVYALLHLSNHP